MRFVDPRPPDNVFPIGGHRLPPPPGWEEPPPVVADNIAPPPRLMPEDFTPTGAIRCTAKSKTNQERCRQPAVIGSNVCRYHGAGGQISHPDDPRPNARTLARNRVLDAVRLKLEELAEKAANALEEILDDSTAKPSDRLKAIELTLDRSVGKQISVEHADKVKRDLDDEILEIVNQLQTGTDG